MSKKDEKILELGYTVDALLNEIEDLVALVDQKQDRIVELIRENDRLTLTFEPYIPEDDEDHGLSFYGLKEDNDVLTKKVENFKGMIRKQDTRIWTLEAGIRSLETKPPKVKKNRLKKLFSGYAGDIAIDWWPPSDWFRFSVSKWRPGQYFQLVIGPVRFEFFAA